MSAGNSWYVLSILFFIYFKYSFIIILECWQRNKTLKKNLQLSLITVHCSWAFIPSGLKTSISVARLTQVTGHLGARDLSHPKEMAFMSMSIKTSKRPSCLYSHEHTATPPTQSETWLWMLKWSRLDLFLWMPKYHWCSINHLRKLRLLLFLSASLVHFFLLSWPKCRKKKHYLDNFLEGYFNIFTDCGATILK